MKNLSQMMQPYLAQHTCFHKRHIQYILYTFKNTHTNTYTPTHPSLTTGEGHHLVVYFFLHLQIQLPQTLPEQQK